MADAPCPQPPVLEAFASGARTDGAVESHVSGCAACRAAVEEAREVNRFLSGVRSSLGVPDQAGPPAQD